MPGTWFAVIIIRLRLGDIIPADAKLIEGDFLSVDQSALTGESLPISWGAIALIWGYSIVWAFLTDWVKQQVYGHFSLGGRHHTRFLETAHHHVTPHWAH